MKEAGEFLLYGVSCILLFPSKIFSLGSCVESNVNEQMFKLPPVNFDYWCLGLGFFSCE